MQKYTKKQKDLINKMGLTQKDIDILIDLGLGSPTKKTEPINRYDVFILEAIWLFLEQFEIDSFPLTNKELKDFLDKDPLVIESGLSNTSKDVNESIGKLLFQDYLTMQIYLNVEPAHREFTPTEKSISLLPDDFYERVEFYKNSVIEN